MAYSAAYSSVLNLFLDRRAYSLFLSWDFVPKIETTNTAPYCSVLTSYSFCTVVVRCRSGIVKLNDVDVLITSDAVLASYSVVQLRTSFVEGSYSLRNRFVLADDVTVTEGSHLQN